MRYMLLDGLFMICAFAAFMWMFRIFQPSIKTWQDFLDSLSTRGGNIFVLFFCMALLFIVYIHVVHDGRDSSLGPVAHDLLVGFGGALLGALSAQSSRQQMQDRVEAGVVKPTIIPVPTLPTPSIASASVTVEAPASAPANV